MKNILFKRKLTKHQIFQKKQTCKRPGFSGIEGLTTTSLQMPRFFCFCFCFCFCYFWWESLENQVHTFYLSNMSKQIHGKYVCPCLLRRCRTGEGNSFRSLEAANRFRKYWPWSFDGIEFSRNYTKLAFWYCFNFAILMDIVVSYLNFNSRYHDKCKFVVKLIHWYPLPIYFH